MPKLVAAGLVFVCSAAVLMLEILAGRLLAPYVGVSLQTYTSVIGTVLAGIAVGAWGGGHLADRIDPRRMLGPVIAFGGALALFTVPLVRSMGDATGEGGVGDTLLLAVIAFFLPAVVLSSVTPMVVKLQLRDLHTTGGVVGRLSGISTLGALVGTFVTGYVLVATTPIRTVIYGIGGTLVVVGTVLGLGLSRRDRGTASVLIVLLVVAGGGAAFGAVADEPCQVESPYFCMRVERDVLRPNGRILLLDNLEHSYVDLHDPTYLEFDYTKSFSNAINAAWPTGRPLDALHVGGGGFTMPRYISATRPGSHNIVLELDPAVVRIGRERLGLRTSATLRVRIGDARTGMHTRPANSEDLVVGDAFGSLSVPWHLATREFISDVDRVLRPDGIYVINVIDFPNFKFARAELATLGERFEWVGAIGTKPELEGQYGGNIVLVASHRRLDAGAMEQLTFLHGDVVLRGRSLTRFVAGAPVITDDYAPVDQWLNETRPQ